jgi:dephospho-CoA kinase
LLGVPIFYADNEAKKIYDDEKVKTLLINKYGFEIYLPDGKLNKEKLSKIIFSNQDELKYINSLIHPLVAKAYSEWCEKHKHIPYTLKEAAILFESGAYKELDKVITVSAPVELRINRVMKRDNLTRIQILERMKHQWEEEKRIKYANFVIYNDDEHLVIPQILDLHKKLMDFK